MISVYSHAVLYLTNKLSNSKYSAYKVEEVFRENMGPEKELYPSTIDSVLHVCIKDENDNTIYLGFPLISKEINTIIIDTMISRLTRNE